MNIRRYNTASGGRRAVIDHEAFSAQIDTDGSPGRWLVATCAVKPRYTSVAIAVNRDTLRVLLLMTARTARAHIAGLVMTAIVTDD